MKPRTVVVEIEMETSVPIAMLKRAYKISPATMWGAPRKILEVRVNVIRATKRKASGKARRK